MGIVVGNGLGEERLLERKLLGVRRIRGAPGPSPIPGCTEEKGLKVCGWVAE